CMDVMGLLCAEVKPCRRRLLVTLPLKFLRKRWSANLRTGGPHGCGPLLRMVAVARGADRDGSGGGLPLVGQVLQLRAGSVKRLGSGRRQGTGPREQDEADPAGGPPMAAGDEDAT